MLRRDQIATTLPLRFWAIAIVLSLPWLPGSLCFRAEAGSLAQDQAEVTPDATPEIQQVTPAQAAVGSDVTVVITGNSFSAGAYVSFSDPSVHVVSSQRTSRTQLEAKLTISPKATPGKLSLFVSNPASAVAESSFTITSASSPPPVVTPATNLQPTQPTAENLPVAAGTPEVSKVDPPGAGRGGGATLKITGKSFVQGVKVAFANPGIQVLDTEFSKSTELTVNLTITADAATGTASLFVVNPDDREAEAQFEVTTATPGKIPTITGRDTPKQPSTSGGAGTTTTTAADQTFSVFSLANAMSIFQTAGKTKGSLIISGKTLKYQEGGKDVFSVPLSDVQEVQENIVFGVSSGTFHIILKSGKMYQFISSALRPADTQKIITALQAAIK